jgi:hypothetical protein
VLSATFALFTLATGVIDLAAGGPSPRVERPEVAASAASAASVQAAAFESEARAVSNWRREALHGLSPAPLAALAVVLGVERPVITRCVKLNNYWCIKSARWAGEIGSDDEGHVGFASADHGADAAVRLLRRYYLDFDRKSALEIVRRWAPAECRVAGASGSPVVLALRGLGNTLRARWLAARRAAPARTRVAAAGRAVAVPQRPRTRVSAVPMRPLPTVRLPSIMAGLEPQKPVTISASLSAPRRQRNAAAGRTSPAPAVAKAAPRPVVAAAVPPSRPETAAPAVPPRASPPAAGGCGSDEQRIQNYASRIVAGLGLRPGDDLKLFEPEGRPLPNLSHGLLARSAFELGHLGARLDLVAGAVARAAAATAPAEEPHAPVPAQPVL